MYIVPLPFAHDGSGGAARGIMEYVATFAGGRAAAAAFRLWWHSVFCVGRLRPEKYTLNVWSAPRPRFFIYPLCAFFVSLLSFVLCFSFSFFFPFPFPFPLLTSFLPYFFPILSFSFPFLFLFVGFLSFPFLGFLISIVYNNNNKHLFRLCVHT